MTSSPVFIAPSPVPAMGRALRIFLLTGTILALATVAFVLGRVSVGSSSAPTTAPAVSTQLPTATDEGTCQQFVHYGSVAC
jgi:hypothetical protein